MIRRPSKTLLAALLVSLAAILLWSACDLSADCVTIGCPQDLECNESTGECETPTVTRCTDPNVSCPEGERCDEATGLCRTLGATCGDQPCPGDQICNTSTGFCEVILDCQADPCTSPAEVCDRVTNRCVPKSCQVDDDCGGAHYCSDAGECRDGCRARESNCPAGQFCRVVDGADVGQCTDVCRSDTECPIGQSCQQSGDGTTCLPQSCDTDLECRGEAVCRGEFCVPPPCTSADDCADGEFCNAATGQCLGGSCQDDNNAPNHRFDQATRVESRNLRAVLCPGRPDWYAYDLRSADTFSLRLEELQDDFDLDVYVYAEDRELIALDQSTTPVSLVSVVSKRRQTVYVEVRGDNDATADYQISFDQNPDIQCRDDTNEENDARPEATELSTTPGRLTRLSMTICGADEDWFVLRDLPADVGLSLLKNGGQDHVRADLLGPDGFVTSLNGSELDTNETLRIRRLGIPGDYFLRVHSTQNRNADDLRLEVEVTAPIECNDAQQNSSPDTAFTQPPGPPNDSYRLCPLQASWEVDWMALDAPQSPAFIYVQLTPSEGLPDLNVDLFRRTAEGELEPVRSAIRRATTDSDIYEMRAPIEPDDDFFVRLSSDGTPGRIIEQINYQIFYRFEPL